VRQPACGGAGIEVNLEKVGRLVFVRHRHHEAASIGPPGRSGRAAARIAGDDPD